jgi:hypothetical protein
MVINNSGNEAHVGMRVEENRRGVLGFPDVKSLTRIVRGFDRY